MADSLLCPECGEALRPRARRCSCGWSRPVEGSTSDVDPFRCSWVSGGKRCRYPGTTSEGTLGQGPWYCAGHVRARRAGDGVLGHRTVEESQQLPVMDYSGEGMKKASLAAYRARPIPLATGEHVKRVPDSIAAVIDRHIRQPGQDG